MAAASTDAFGRTFPRREWFAGLGRIALVWALLNGVLTCLLLLEAGLVVGLLVDRGTLVAVLSEVEISEFERVTGMKVVAGGDAESAPPPPKSAPVPAAVTPPEPQEPEPATTEPLPREASPATDSGPEEDEELPADGEESAAPLKTSPNDFLQPAPAQPNPRVEGSQPVHVQRFEDHGMLPSVWRSRDTWWGGVLSASYRKFPWLQENVAALIVLLVVFALTWLLRVWCLAQLRSTCRGVALEVSTRLRRQLHRQSMRLATEDVDGGGLVEAVQLFRQEVDRVRQGLFEWLLRSARYPWELLFLVLAAFSVELLMATQWVLLSILGGYLIIRSQQQAERTRALAADRAERELGSLADSMRAAKLIRGYGMDVAEQNEFQVRLKKYLDAVAVQNRVQDDPLWLRLMVSLACVALASFLFFVLGAKVLGGEVSAPGAAVFLAAFTSGLIAVRELRRLPEFQREVSVTADKVWRYLDQLPTVSQAVGARFVQPLSKSLHIVDASYKLPSGKPLLDRVDLKLTAGRTYAVVSLDPLEARAFAYLLPRFIEPQSGRILFDGEDIAWGTLESIRAETLFVTASDPLLAGTALDNIRASQREITLNQATEAAKEARAHNFLSRLPQGYETVLDGQESLLDPGQRLRLSLARALLRKPSVLIIEEPSEGLDEDTKQLLDDTYDRICPGRTVFFLPSRLSTLRRADDILMLKGGRIEAMGSHVVLVKESPLYRHWEYLHFNEFRHDDA